MWATLAFNELMLYQTVDIFCLLGYFIFYLNVSSKKLAYITLSAKRRRRLEQMTKLFIVKTFQQTKTLNRRISSDSMKFLNWKIYELILCRKKVLYLGSHCNSNRRWLSLVILQKMKYERKHNMLCLSLSWKKKKKRYMQRNIGIKKNRNFKWSTCFFPNRFSSKSKF